MRILFDTSVLIEIDRRKKEVIDLMKDLSDSNAELMISTVTVSEFLTGVFLQEKPSKHIIKAKELLMQFRWAELDGATAEETAELIAYRLRNGTPVDYQDNVIAASLITTKSDFLVTLNVSHFNVPMIKEKVYSSYNFHKKFRNKELA